MQLTLVWNVSVNLYQPLSTSCQPHINLISTYINLISTYFHPCQADDFAGGVASITLTNNACALRKSRVGGVHAVREARVIQRPLMIFMQVLASTTCLSSTDPGSRGASRQRLVPWI